MIKGPWEYSRGLFLSEDIMIETILTFLTENKSICVGAAITITEVATIFINWHRKLEAEHSRVTSIGAGIVKTEPVRSKILWSINPINLFRKA